MTVGSVREVNELGEIRYYVNGEYHREDGPAYIGIDGEEEWCLNNKTHRTDGPAITWSDGTVRWVVNNKKCNTRAEYKEAANLTDEDILALVLKYDKLMLGN